MSAYHQTFICHIPCIYSCCFLKCPGSIIRHTLDTSRHTTTDTSLSSRAWPRLEPFHPHVRLPTTTLTLISRARLPGTPLSPGPRLPPSPSPAFVLGSSVAARATLLERIPIRCLTISHDVFPCYHIRLGATKSRRCSTFGENTPNERFRPFSHHTISAGLYGNRP